jgi:hypothetical protein
MATSSVALDALIGVAALALVELVALVLEARRSHPPGVPVRARLATLGTALAVAGGLTAVVAWSVTLPVDDVALVAALGVAAVVLVTRLVVSLGSAASRS